MRLQPQLILVQVWRPHWDYQGASPRSCAKTAIQMCRSSASVLVLDAAQDLEAPVVRTLDNMGLGCAPAEGSRVSAPTVEGGGLQRLGICCWRCGGTESSPSEGDKRHGVSCSATASWRAVAGRVRSKATCHPLAVRKRPCCSLQWPADTLGPAYQLCSLACPIALAPLLPTTLANCCRLRAAVPVRLPR